jgi:Lon protease-like protein
VVAVPPDRAWLLQVVQQALAAADDSYRHVSQRDDAAWVSNRLAELLPLALPDRQALLEIVDPLERLAVLEPAVRRARA